MMSTTVAPSEDESMVTTRACLEAGAPPLFGSAPDFVRFCSFVVSDFELSRLRVCVLADLAMESSSGLIAMLRRTTEAPHQPSSRRGTIPELSIRPGLHTVLLGLQNNASHFWTIITVLCCPLTAKTGVRVP